MRILVVHNYYQLRGGEDSVVSNEVELLRKNGHVVQLYSVSNDDIRSRWKTIKTAVGLVYNFSARRALERYIRAFSPDVVHIHNFFPLLSPSVVDAARRAGIPVVLTLHNFRTQCPTGVLFLDGAICERSLGRSTWWALSRKVYRDSFFGTLCLICMIEWHKFAGTWRKKPDAIIALTPFAKEKFVTCDIPQSLIHVKPNAADAPSAAELTAITSRNDALYVGRLSEEKGLRTLIYAWQNIHSCCLRIAGDGPMAQWIAEQNITNVVLLGRLDREGVRREMLRAAFLVSPSVCYEMFPVAIAEAYGCGLPVIASRLGGVASLVEDGVTGLLFEPGNAGDLKAKVDWALTHTKEMHSMGGMARLSYDRSFTPDANLNSLVRIYGAARSHSASKRRLTNNADSGI